VGSWCDLAVDGFSVHGSKSYVDDETLSLFHERDRRVRPDPDDQDGEEIHLLYEYAISAQNMRERLDALGFTAKLARRVSPIWM
jgi:HEPN/Toprim N-terminal domain 1